MGGCRSGQTERSVKPSSQDYSGSNPLPPTKHISLVNFRNYEKGSHLDPSLCYNFSVEVKDFFNGNIRPERKAQARMALILFPVVMFALSVLILCFAIFYERMDIGARIIAYTLSVLGFLSSILYPILAICFVRRWPKYPRLAKIFLQDYMFVYPEKDEQQSEKTQSK